MIEISGTLCRKGIHVSGEVFCNCVWYMWRVCAYLPPCWQQGSGYMDTVAEVLSDVYCMNFERCSQLVPWHINGCFRKIRVYTPKSSHFNRVFHSFHHPFWGCSPLIFGVFHPNSKKLNFRWGEELPRRDTCLSDACATVSRAFRVQVPGIFVDFLDEKLMSWQIVWNRVGDPETPIFLVVKKVLKIVLWWKLLSPSCI